MAAGIGIAVGTGWNLAGCGAEEAIGLLTALGGEETGPEGATGPLENMDSLGFAGPIGDATGGMKW